MTKMRLFLLLIAAHWVEHIYQSYQVWVLHMHRECALGFLGMRYPWLIRTECLHFAFAGFTFVGMWFFGKNYFWDLKAARLWTIGFFWAGWHLIEHTLLIIQANSHPWYGRSVPTSILQLAFPRIELHLFYNSIITLYILYALIREYHERNCDCGRCSHD